MYLGHSTSTPMLKAMPPYPLLRWSKGRVLPVLQEQWHSGRGWHLAGDIMEPILPPLGGGKPMQGSLLAATRAHLHALVEATKRVPRRLVPRHKRCKAVCQVWGRGNGSSHTVRAPSRTWGCGSPAAGRQGGSGTEDYATAHCAIIAGKLRWFSAGRVPRNGVHVDLPSSQRVRPLYPNGSFGATLFMSGSNGQVVLDSTGSSICQCLDGPLMHMGCCAFSCFAAVIWKHLTTTTQFDPSGLKCTGWHGVVAAPSQAGVLPCNW